MLYQANMPKSFWAEAITTGSISTKSPSKRCSQGIPYELWHNKTLTPADLKALKPFGCMYTNTSLRNNTEKIK
jgi:hypothetical protein